MRKRLFAGGAIVIVGAIVALIANIVLSKPDQYVSLINKDRLQGLPIQDHSNIDTSHLLEGLTPPTNKWFSSLALQKIPKAVFPTPLSFLPGASSFEIGLPNVISTEKTIFGSHAPALSINIPDAKSYKVIRYDELSVDIEYASDREKLGVVTITAGSPYIFFKASSSAKILVGGSGSMTIEKTEAEISDGRNTSKVMGFDGVTLTRQDKNIVGTMPKDGYLAFYILPKGAEDVLKSNAVNIVTGTEVAYVKNANTYQTKIHLKTASLKPTVLGFLPHQNTNQEFTTLNYQTLYGKMNTAAGSTFAFSTPSTDVRDGLNLEKIEDYQRQLLVDTLRKDINATRFETIDTYFSGKALYRAAQLLELANQLEQPKLASSIQKKLTDELDLWFSDDDQSEKYFYYNPKVKGIVGVTSAFGSEEFNDHHFHYGYFIYAASILAKYDNNFLLRHEDSVNLLVADIANYNRDEELPLRRHFDPYFGHSWASGSAPFNDGNNQESSSEALTAWTAVSLWAERTGDSKLSDEANWMLSNETTATNAYWLDFDASRAPYNLGYKKSIVSLNWGGKRDYATFFSGDPNAILGIQLIPMNPSMRISTTAPTRISQNVREALPQDSYNVPFGDYILMYQSTSGIQDPLKIAESLEDKYIDGANSRSYLYAWLFANGHPL